MWSLEETVWVEKVECRDFTPTLKLALRAASVLSTQQTITHSLTQEWKKTERAAQTLSSLLRFCPSRFNSMHVRTFLKPEGILHKQQGFREGFYKVQIICFGVLFLIFNNNLFQLCPYNPVTSAPTLRLHHRLYQRLLQYLTPVG